MTRKSEQSVEEGFKSLKILKISDMIRIELAKFGYDIAKSIQPQPVQKMMELRGGKKEHRYPTRGKNIPNVE